jgi:hypothetical protein
MCLDPTGNQGDRFTARILERKGGSTKASSSFPLWADQGPFGWQVYTAQLPLFVNRCRSFSHAFQSNQENVFVKTNTRLSHLAVTLRLSFLASCLAFAGCDPLAGSTPVEGKVTVDGQPLSAGRIAFVSADTAAATGKFDIAGIVANGQYKMTTNGKAGVPPGKYKVTVSTAGSDSGGDPMKMGTAPPTALSAPQRLVNQKYELVSTTDLMITVPSPTYDLTLSK